MAREAIQALMAFDDDQIVQGLVWGMNSEQCLRFLRLTEDTFGLEMLSETEAESLQVDEPGPATDVVEQFVEPPAAAVETQPTLVTDLEVLPLPDPKQPSACSGLSPRRNVRTHSDCAQHQGYLGGAS